MIKHMTAEQRVQRAVFKIMAHPRYAAVAPTMMIGERLIKDGLPTACTNGRDEYYGREFVESLNDPQLRFLVLHENRHKIYRHLTTWQWMWEEDPQLANMACDHVINIEIVDENPDGFATMDGPLSVGCYNPKYRGWDSAKVFRDLKKQQQGQGQGQGQPLDEHDWQGAKSLSDEEKQELNRSIDEGLRQGAMVASKTGSGGARDFSELLKPKVDWRAELRKFVTETCRGSDYSSWRRPNRRLLSAGVYMPSGVSEKVGELVIAPDMSGSTFHPSMMRAIMSEVKGIAESIHVESIRLLYWDTKICKEEVYKGAEVSDLINTTKPEGGGGTDVECVARHIRENNIKAQAVIVLTDGYLAGTWGSWTHPVLWVVADNPKASPPVGKVVHIKSDDVF